jgi:outer membrane biosynthesis protein TonB
MGNRSAFILVSIASLIGILVCSDDCVAADNPYPCYEPARGSRFVPGDSCVPGDGDFVYDVGPNPLPGHMPQPEYPKIALKYPDEYNELPRGPVELALCVGTDGKVLKWRPARMPLPPQFMQAIDEAMRQWQFSPAICHGQPVVGRTTVTISLNPSRASAEEAAARRKFANQIKQEQVPSSSEGDPCPVDGDLLPKENLPQPLSGHQPAPAYPDYMEPKLGGWVTVAICVDKYGVVRQWDVYSNGLPELAQEIDIVMPYWRFTPATYHGHPIGVRTSMRFFFTPPPAPPDTTPDGLAKASLRACDPKVQIEKKVREWITVSIRGQIPSDSPASTLETVYGFLEDYCVFFNLSDPRSEITFIPYELRPFSHHEDSTVSDTRYGQQVSYHLVQTHAGVPVLGSSLEVVVRIEGPVLTAITARLLPDVCVNNAPTLTEQDASDVVQTLTSGPDRHCSPDQPRLWVTRIDEIDYFVWIIDLSCHPDEGFAWGEQVWVDAQSGEILKKMGTWIE